ncbi:HAD-like superfamily [Arabidopsis thaliana x Arabidopsis arenosa]|uniref:HAD-like superfamily n=1 Tax=Arabidopsis thaliana x Arabidopsis arenosa TaxID=1240361 RepID=A0A8T1Y5J4_9BRAS|nr:HAD-like superfamily [Arabidopsis thaliana x Arabidopsis arenosa]
MRIFVKLLLLFSLFPLAFSNENSSSYLIPRPLIKNIDDNVNLHCTSWRFAAETNNLAPWKTIPAECADYVKDYLMGEGYVVDVERVSEEAKLYASSFQSNGDGKDIWIFDIDETLLSNLPYYMEHGCGLEVFNHSKFDKWVEKGIAPAIAPSLKLYQKVIDLGYKVILLTGRRENHRVITVENLRNAGFHNWDKLILRSLDDRNKTATMYKSEKREEMVKEGYRIRGNSGDQWSDLLGSAMSERSFKLPNPMYYIP